MRPGTETIERLRPAGAPGRHGARPTDLIQFIGRCHLVPRASTEADGGPTNTVIVGYTLIAPGDADLVATDRIRWRGRVWEIDGMPGVYEKRGRRVAVIAALKLVTG